MQTAEQTTPPAVDSAVKKWNTRINKAKSYWEERAFKRMRMNIEFASGLQWEKQKDLDDERYVCNLTLRQISQKVATLYAKNPEFEAVVRDRMWFTVWDGDIMSLDRALVRLAANPMDIEALAIQMDHEQGRQAQKMAEKVAETMEKLFKYQVDVTKPGFKEQMKQLVRRVITTGVGFVRLHFVSEPKTPLLTTEIPHLVADRLGRIQALQARMLEEGYDDSSEEIETLRSLMLSIQNSVTMQDDVEMDQRLEFDFPLSTSVIVDPKCRSLKEFVGARWVVQEFCLPKEDVKAAFGEKYQPEEQREETGEEPKASYEASDERESEDEVVVREVFDYATKTRFIIAKGYGNYLLEPEPLVPSVSGFWPLFALTFNDVEVDPDSKATIYPPSDVDLVRHPQKEWNRTRNALRDQRNANAPTYLVRKNLLTLHDKEALQNRKPNQVIELEGIPQDMEVSKAIGVLQVAAIDPAVYNTQPLIEDVLYSNGMQSANMGPAQPNVTATTSTIAEQSRLTVSASNIDDLDDLLSRLAQAGFEMLFFMNELTVKQIVGPGAAFPQQSKQEYINQIMMKVKAGSSGRPNKALEIANYQQIAPQLISAGANPVGVIQEGVKRLDDELQLDNFLPALPPPAAPGQGNVTPINDGKGTAMLPGPSGQDAMNAS